MHELPPEMQNCPCIAEWLMRIVVEDGDINQDIKIKMVSRTSNLFIFITLSSINDKYGNLF